MNKASAVYAILLLVCAGGLWGILQAGSHLSAVADLSGEWTIEGGPLGPGGVSPEQLGTSFTIEQSGRFFRLHFAKDRIVDLKATVIGMGAIDEPMPVTLTNGENSLSGNIRPAEETLQGEFTLSGPNGAKFLARRVAKSAQVKKPGA